MNMQEDPVAVAVIAQQVAEIQSLKSELANSRNREAALRGALKRWQGFMYGDEVALASHTESVLDRSEQSGNAWRAFVEAEVIRKVDLLALDFDILGQEPCCDYTLDMFAKKLREMAKNGTLREILK